MKISFKKSASVRYYPFIFLMVALLFMFNANCQNITKVEYFVDTDPGFGLGNNVPVTPAANISNLQFTIGLGAVPAGFHTLYVRAKDAGGHWSLSQVKSFYKSEFNAVAFPNVTRAEYFIDTDPGFGMGNNIPVTPSTNISNLQFTIGLGTVPTGFHTLYVRVKDGHGRWSFSQISRFYKPVINTVALPNVTKVEYFFDNDPGMGMGTDVPVTPSANISNLSFIIDLNSLSAGNHTVWIRAKDSYGKWSMVVWNTFTQCGLPALCGSISGPASVCVGAQGVTYSVSPVPNATTYLWIVPTGATITGGSGTNSITVNFATSAFTGNISVRGTNTCGNGPQSPNLTVTSRVMITGQASLFDVVIPLNGLECWAFQTITTAGSGTTFLVEGGGEVTLVASQSIRLLPGTTVRRSGILHAFITTQCIPCSLLKITDADSNKSTGGQIGEVIPDHPVRSSISVYPNPTAAGFTLEFKKETRMDNVCVEIYNAQGKKLLTKNLVGERRHVFSLSDHPAGVYFIRVISGTEVETIKVIKN
jgi:hypothetical protein